MNLTVLIDWKFVVALGATAVGIIFAMKIDESAVERVSIHAIEAVRSTQFLLTVIVDSYT